MEKPVPYETLADSLDRLEVQLSRLEQDSEVNALGILTQMDEIHNRITDLKATGRNMVAESSQYDYVSATLKKNGGKFIRRIGGEAGMNAARQKENPPADHWWWYLDQYLIEKRRTTLKKSLVGAGIALAAVVILAIIYNRFLAPDPVTQAILSHSNQATNLIDQGNLAGALNEIDLALNVAPEDTDLLLTRGILLQKLGRGDDAKEVFNKVEDLMKDQTKFFTNRSLIYLQVGDPQSALADGLEAVKLNPNSPEAFFQIGKAYDLMGQIPLAIDAYQTASDLASAQGKSEMVPLIRMNLGMAMQRSGLPQSSDLTPTPTSQQ